MTLRLAQYEPTPAPATQPAPRGVQWISLDEAVERWDRTGRPGGSRGHLQRCAATDWFVAGLARQERRPGDHKPKWYVREDAAPELGRVLTPEHVGADLTGLTDAQRAEAVAKRQILDEWEASQAGRLSLGMSAKAAAEQFCRVLEARGLPPAIGRASVSRATLYNWQAAYRAGGLRALADDRRSKGRAASEAPEYSFYFERLKFWYLDGRRRSIQVSHELAMGNCLERGAPHPVSVDTAERFVKKLPRQVVILHREGPKAFTDKCAPFIARDYSGLATNDVWCADDHTFDVIVRVGERLDAKTGEMVPVHARPTLTAFEDLRSRRIVGYHIGAKAANTDCIIQAFDAAVTRHGTPLRVMIDNGKTYDSKDLQGITKRERRRRLTPEELRRIGGVFGMLQVEVQHVEPYHGQSKPIERAFGTICSRFATEFRTYTGPGPERKPHDLQDHVDAGRAPTLDEFCLAFGEWLARSYHQRPHVGNGMEGRTPEQAYSEFLVRERRVGREMRLLACMPPHGPVKVHQQGVTYAGRDYGATSSEVQAMYGREVYLRIDRNDVSSVLVCELDGRPVGWASENRRLPVVANKDDVRQAKRELREATRVHRDYHRVRTRLADDPHTALLRAAAARAEREGGVEATGAGDAPPPAPISPVRIPFEEEARELMARRPAAGQEGQHPAARGGDPFAARAPREPEEVRPLLLIGRPDASPAADPVEDGLAESNAFLRHLGRRSIDRREGGDHV